MGTHHCDVTTLQVHHYGAHHYISFLDNQPRSIIGVHTSVGWVCPEGGFIVDDLNVFT